MFIKKYLWNLGLLFTLLCIGSFSALSMEEDDSTSGELRYQRVPSESDESLENKGGTKKEETTLEERDYRDKLVGTLLFLIDQRKEKEEKQKDSFLLLELLATKGQISEAMEEVDPLDEEIEQKIEELGIEDEPVVQERKEDDIGEDPVTQERKEDVIGEITDFWGEDFWGGAQEEVIKKMIQHRRDKQKVLPQIGEKKSEEGPLKKDHQKKWKVKEKLAKMTMKRGEEKGGGTGGKLLELEIPEERPEKGKGKKESKKDDTGNSTQIWDNLEKQIEEQSRKDKIQSLNSSPQAAQKGPWDQTKIDLSKLITGRVPELTSSIFIFPQPPFDSNAHAMWYGVMKDFDRTLFDEGVVPRDLLKCCPPRYLWGLSVIKGVSGLAGGVLVPLAMTAFSNVVFGETFKYPVNGGASYTMLILSIIVNGPVSGLIYYDLAQQLIEKKRSSFQAPTTIESQGNCTHARIFPKSKAHKVLELLLRPASAAYALPAIALWLEIQKSFQAYGIVMSIPISIYYAEPYRKIGKKVLWDWFADNYYIQGHSYKEMRKGFVARLDGLRKAIEADANPKRGGKESSLIEESGYKKDELTEKIWKLLKEETKAFGKNVKDDKEDILNATNGYISISLLSLLLTKSVEVLNESGEEGLRHSRNQTLIQEKSPDERVINQAVNGLMWLSFVPGLEAESNGVYTALSLFGASEASAKAIGWVSALLFSSRLLLEKELHKKTFTSWRHPFSPSPPDHIGIRRALGAKVVLYSVLNAAIFTILTAWSLDSVSLSEKTVFLTVTALRYFSLFYAIGSMMYNEVVTTVSTRNKNNPTPEQKRAHLYDLIERAKHLVRYELTNETIEAINSGI